MKKIRLFEAFAGIGSQSKALHRLIDETFVYENVGISEWDIDAVISYDALNNDDKDEIEIPSIEEIKVFLSQFTYSLDSKKESKST